MLGQNVVPITRTEPRRYKGITSAEGAMDVVRRHMYGHDHKELASRCGVSVSCIFAIRSGRTKWPRATTFFMLLYVLDLELLVQPRSHN